MYLQIITITIHKCFVFSNCYVFLSLTWVATIILRQVIDSRYSKNFNDRNSELDNVYQS